MKEAFGDLHSFFSNAVAMLVEDKSRCSGRYSRGTSLKTGSTPVSVETGGISGELAAFFSLLFGGRRFLRRCVRSLLPGVFLALIRYSYAPITQ